MNSAIQSDEQMEIIRFCATECDLQASGERSVWWMLEAWNYALWGALSLPTEADILAIGAKVEPVRNADGYRRCNVRVSSSVKPRWQDVPKLMAELVDELGKLDPAEWYRAYEEVHAWVDGNGRSGAILYCWLSGTLDSPEWPPNFWSDPRRLPGAGAP